MRAPFSMAIFGAMLLIPLTGAQAQSAARDTKATASISGTVTIDGKPARGIKVVALEGDTYERKPVAIDSTDINGHYHLKSIPAGQCRVTLEAPGFATKDKGDDRYLFTKAVSLDEGENIEGIDFEMTRGGVITGRITEASGRPIIDETVEIIPFKEGSKYVPYSLREGLRVKTDDRGIYRAYGLPPGRYWIRVGYERSGRMELSFGRVSLPMTFYPGVTDESKAEVVEVAAGGEVTGIDIKVSRPPKDRTKTYIVTGRIVDAETGRPIPGVHYSCDKKFSFEDDETDDLKGGFDEYGESNPKGEFLIDKIPPGKYEIAIWTRDESPWYSEKVSFEISSSDLDGLVIKARRAGSISGVVVLEGTNDPEVVARLSRLKIGTGPMPVILGMPVNKDGTFRLIGIGPGLHQLSIDSGSRREGFELLRVEQDGVELDDVAKMLRRIKVGPGENVTGVRLVVAYYKGVIRGQIKIEGGTLPEGGYLVISATPLNQPKKDYSWSRSKRLALSLSRWRRGSIDARGRFVIERLPPGEYEVNLDAYLTPYREGNDDDLPITVTKIVTVTGESDVEIALVIDLSKKPEEKRQ